MQEVAAPTEHLSTFGGRDRHQALHPFGLEPVVLCQAAVWTRQKMTGCLEEKSVWVHRYWDAVRQAMPEAEGCRLGWNTVFFALPNENITQAVQSFGEVLRSRQEADLMSFCVLCEVAGEPMHKIDVLDVLEHETSSIQDFGASREYRPTGYKFYYLLDGKPYIIK